MTDLKLTSCELQGLLSILRKRVDLIRLLTGYWLSRICSSKFSSLIQANVDTILWK